MKVIETKQELKIAVTTPAYPIVLVPTMGALHRGHAALISRAREIAGSQGLVVVSIFVNPIQFDRKSDLNSYPRPIDQDLQTCKKCGADIVFMPNAAEMYARDRSISVIENSLATHLCGAARAGHFDGVCTVVLKLFFLSRCHTAIFGEKDFQQLAIIQRMVRDLDVGVEIIPHPTLRENDGLAMSSRNIRLSPEHRADAPRIRRALLTAARETHVSQILDEAREIIEESDYAKIDYLTLVNQETLQPASDLKQPTVLACAVFYGNVRLIDHILIPQLL